VSKQSKAGLPALYLCFSYSCVVKIDRFLWFLSVLCADDHNQKVRQQGTTAAAHAACAGKTLQARAPSLLLVLVLVLAETGVYYEYT